MGSLTLVLMWFWVMCPPHPWTVSGTEVFYLSNLDKKVVSARIMMSLGSVFVHYFYATMLLHFTVTFLVRSVASTSVSVSQFFIIISMK